MNQNLFQKIRWYYDSSGKKDEGIVINAFSDDRNIDELNQLAKEHWDKASEKPVNLEHVLHRIHYKLNLLSNQAHRRPKTFILHFQRIAAVLLLPLLFVSVYLGYQSRSFTNSYTEIQAPPGSRVHFSLPDGSAGVLNGGSDLRYAANFKNKRDLQLQGEAYFEVKKDRNHPFTVATKNADIQVLGTKFDVCAYNDSEEIYTTLEEGSVQVFDKQNERNALLKPGEQNIIQRSSGKMITKKVETSLYTSWREDVLKIDNTPFEKVVKLMEHWYGVTIQLDPNLKYSQTYTLTIKAESLREMLQLLKITTPFNYQINGNKVIITKAES